MLKLPKIARLSPFRDYQSFFYLISLFSSTLHPIETFFTIERKLIWNAKYDIEKWGWRKAIVELPNDLDEYRLLFEGAYESFRPPPSYPRNHVTIDNLEMRKCSVKGKLFMSLL